MSQTQRTSRLVICALTLLLPVGRLEADPIGTYRITGNVTEVRQLDAGLKPNVSVEVGDPVTGYLRIAEPYSEVIGGVWSIQADWEFCVGTFRGFGSGPNVVVARDGHWFEFNGSGEQGESNVGVQPWSFNWAILASHGAPMRLPDDFTGPGRVYGDWAGMVVGHQSPQWLNFHADFIVERVPEPSSLVAFAAALLALALAVIPRRGGALR